MRLVQVIKMHSQYDYYDNESHSPATKWTEVTDEEFKDLVDAVNKARYLGKPYQFVLIEQLDDYTDVFEDAKEFTKQVQAREAASKLKAEKAKATREANALEKKRKQLEKLKKELESE